jgi:hypothetical protein
MEIEVEVDWAFEIVCRMGVDYKRGLSKGKITVVHHDRLKRGYASVNGGNVVCPAPELGVTGWFTLLPQTTFNLIATMLHISHGLGLGNSGKTLIRLIGTALLRSNTLRGNTVVIAILVGKNIIVEGWCNMIL